MSDLEKKAAEYAHLVDEYKERKLSINPVELSNYHSISEQQFDDKLSQLEDALQEDIKKIPGVLEVFDKIINPLKRIFK